MTDAAGKEMGVIGQGGKLLARGLAEKGELNVQWEKDGGKAVCSLSYSLPVRKRASGYQPLQSFELPCVTGGTAAHGPAVSELAVPAQG